MLNLHVFPFSLTPALPDVDPPGTDAPAFALPSPADRLLPFVLQRPSDTSRRLDCARIVDADTGATIRTLDLNPVLPTPDYGLAYEKYTGPADGGTDYFVYFGAIIPKLQLTPCQRYRLVVDEFASAVFSPLPASELETALRVEWYHPGPLAGVPYGTGLRQRLYVPGAALRFAAPREEKEVRKDAITGAETVDFLALTRAATFTTEPLPAWLVEAVFAAKAHALLEVDGQRLTGLTVKETVFGADRLTLELTAYDTQVLVARACVPPVMAAVPADDYEPHGYLCGLPDNQPHWQDDGYTECAQDQGPDWQDDGYTECKQD